MSDPPIGRVGYVFNGFGDSGANVGGTEYRCTNRECRVWFPAASACPRCGTGRPGFNKPLRTAQLNGALYKQIAQAEKQKIRGLA